MGHYLFGAKPLFKSMLTYCQLNRQEETSVHKNENTMIFIHENENENVVCKISPILS